MRKSGLSKIAVALVILFVIAVDNNLGLWKDDGRVIVNDVYAYYAYLPSVFIHKDITLDYLNYSHVGDQFVIWPKLTPDGKR